MPTIHARDSRHHRNGLGELASASTSFEILRFADRQCSVHHSARSVQRCRTQRVNRRILDSSCRMNGVTTLGHRSLQSVRRRAFSASRVAGEQALNNASTCETSSVSLAGCLTPVQHGEASFLSLRCLLAVVSLGLSEVVTSFDGESCTRCVCEVANN
jgi:hypothetical protein